MIKEVYSALASLEKEENIEAPVPKTEVIRKRKPKKGKIKLSRKP
jgi:hypothetical protein